jgi:hypothetical protein
MGTVGFCDFFEFGTGCIVRPTYGDNTKRLLKGMPGKSVLDGADLLQQVFKFLPQIQLRGEFAETTL